jgi:hypothetical protein
MRFFLTLAALLLLITGLSAGAQSVSCALPDGPDRSIKLLREDEDWSFLANPANRQDFWDPVKYIRLRSGSDDWFMTISGEARQVWEQIGNDNWGQAPYWNGYLNQRYMLGLDVHYGQHVRTFVDFKSGINFFRIGGPRPIDEKKLDFQAAFLQVGTAEGKNFIELRAGIPTVRTRKSMPREFEIPQVLPYSLRQANYGQSSMSEMASEITLPLITRLMSRKAPSMAGHGFTSAATKIRAIKASTPTCKAA